MNVLNRLEILSSILIREADKSVHGKSNIVKKDLSQERDSNCMKLRTLFAFILLAPAFAQEAPDQLLRHWDYDRGAPLNMKPIGNQDRDGAKVYDITFASPVGDRGASVGPNGGLGAAYLVVPSGKGPFPAAIYGHWCMPGSGEKNRSEFLDQALVLAHSGVISLFPDHLTAL